MKREFQIGTTGDNSGDHGRRENPLEEKDTKLHSFFVVCANFSKIP
jgi:hypothetical protein